MNILRKIVALAAGIIICSIAVGLVQKLGHYLYPFPEGADPNNPETVKEYIKTAPFMAVFFVILSYMAGAVSGGFFSTWIAGDGKKIYALIIGVFFLATSVYMMSVIPSPLWCWILGILSWLFVFLGWKLAVKIK